MKLLVIFNPNAANGRSAKLLSDVKNHFTKNQIDAEFVLTEYCGHGRVLVEEADMARFDGVVAAGGDGTVFEVVNGLLQKDGTSPVPLGVLPVGELAVVVAAAAPHRKTAFDACQRFIDRLKEDVPIFKHEERLDGSVWIGMGP